MAGLSKTSAQGHWWKKQFHLKALDGVDLTLEEGKTLAIVGKSGSGKKTLAMRAALPELPDSGKIWFNGRDVMSSRQSGARAPSAQNSNHFPRFDRSSCSVHG
jgi:ABC-type oligopeptide transport system ATPase subunit